MVINLFDSKIVKHVRYVYMVIEVMISEWGYCYYLERSN